MMPPAVMFCARATLAVRSASRSAHNPARRANAAKFEKAGRTRTANNWESDIRKRDGRIKVQSSRICLADWVLPRRFGEVQFVRRKQ
jgi:hypothetical protein